jgi:hypothetical protein
MWDTLYVHITVNQGAENDFDFLQFDTDNIPILLLKVPLTADSSVRRSIRKTTVLPTRECVWKQVREFGATMVLSMRPKRDL